MQVKLQVKFVDGTDKEIAAGATDLVAFEERFDLSVAKLEKEVKLTHLLFIAYNHENRTKATSLDFNAWVETIDTIEAAAAKK